MLIKLLPDQIARYWTEIKLTIHDSLPPTTGDHALRDSSILRSLLIDEMQCWVVCSGEPLNVTVGAIAITTVTVDARDGTRNFLIYALRGFAPLSREDWQDVLVKGEQIARDLKCGKVIGFSKNERVIQLAKSFGWNTDYRVISADLG